MPIALDLGETELIIKIVSAPPEQLAIVLMVPPMMTVQAPEIC